MGDWAARIRVEECNGHIRGKQDRGSNFAFVQGRFPRYGAARGGTELIIRSDLLCTHSSTATLALGPHVLTVPVTAPSGLRSGVLLAGRIQWQSAKTDSGSRTAFVISPIGKFGSSDYRTYKLTLDYIIRKALQPPAWDVVRADDESSPDSITSQVIERIDTSDLIVAVLTDHNPNVFYELAVAHGLKKPVIHLLADGQIMPFDVVDQRAIFYDLSNPESVDAAITGVLDSAEWVLANPGKLRNPLSSYARFSLIAEPGSTGDDVVAETLQEISSRLSILEGRSIPSASRHGTTGMPAEADSFYRSLPGELRNAVSSIGLITGTDGESSLRVRFESGTKLSIGRVRSMKQVADELGLEVNISIGEEFIDLKKVWGRGSSGSELSA